jgi:hypothetical protein
MKMVGILLEIGADRDRKNGKGETPLMIAEKIRLAWRVKQSSQEEQWISMVNLLRCDPKVVDPMEKVTEEVRIIEWGGGV